MGLRLKTPVTCKYCGKEYYPFKQAKAKACSVKCWNAHNKPTVTSEMFNAVTRQNIDALYNNGFGCKRISIQLGLSKHKVRKYCRRSGIIDPNRKSPMTQKGLCRITDEEKAARLIMDEYRKEARNLRQYDESSHWSKHHTAYLWSVARRAAIGRANRSNYSLAKSIRSRVYRVLNGKLKSAPTLNLLGCSLDNFRCHIENQFELGMSWHNYGSHWHLDHIVPCASFDLSKQESQRACFHYTNLRPFPARENISKGAKVYQRLRQRVKKQFLLNAN